MATLRIGRVVVSPATGNRYQIAELLGEGGYGKAYRAQQINRRGKVVDELCLKTTIDQASWHRESYFGELFARNRRVLQVYDSFPIASYSRAATGGMIYCLAMELAEHGTIADYLKKHGEPWPEVRALREIKALLRLLDQLHGGNATHRDITPMNIFVCSRGVLKLGDFGIARHQIPGKPANIEAFNPAFVTQGIIDKKHRYWLAVDDVFQMGQLLGMLLRGNCDEAITPAVVDTLPCSVALKRIVRCAIGPRSRRFPDAYEMLRALEGDEGVAESNVKTLAGKTVVFAGALSLSRFDAEVLVIQAGGHVAKRVNRHVDLIVHGGSASRFAPGRRNAQMHTAERLIKAGQPISVIGESQFRRLVRVN